MDWEKRYCKDKLITKGLQWGCTEFDLLGLRFSVEFDKMLELNLNLNFIKIRELVNIWSRRYLSPLGKISVIKTFLLPKLNHLFLSLPSPTELWINRLNDTFFQVHLVQ